MKTLLASLARKLLGETWTIPLGIGAAVALALVASVVLPSGEWQPAGGFALAALVIATLIRSLSSDRPRPSNPGAAARPDRTDNDKE